jgi:hypothetical protein
VPGEKQDAHAATLHAANDTTDLDQPVDDDVERMRRVDLPVPDIAVTSTRLTDQVVVPLSPRS